MLRPLVIFVAILCSLAAHAADLPRQPTQTLAGLYTLSNRSRLGYLSKMRSHALATGGVFHVAKLKDRTRAIEKMERQFGGDPSRLVDVLRGTVTYPDLRGVYRGFAQIAAHEPLVQVKDSIENPGLGFPHVNLRFQLGNRLIVESQLTTEPFYKAFHGQGGAHRLYEQYRGLNERSAGMSVEERVRRDALADEMRARLGLVQPRPELELETLNRDPAFIARFRTPQKR